MCYDHCCLIKSNFVPEYTVVYVFQKIAITYFIYSNLLAHETIPKKGRNKSLLAISWTQSKNSSLLFQQIMCTTIQRASFHENLNHTRGANWILNYNFSIRLKKIQNSLGSVSIKGLRLNPFFLLRQCIVTVLHCTVVTLVIIFKSKVWKRKTKL